MSDGDSALEKNKAKQRRKGMWLGDDNLYTVSERPYWYVWAETQGKKETWLLDKTVLGKDKGPKLVWHIQEREMRPVQLYRAMRETTVEDKVRDARRLNHSGPRRPLWGHSSLRGEEVSLHWKALSRRIKWRLCCCLENKNQSRGDQSGGKWNNPDGADGDFQMGW